MAAPSITTKPLDPLTGDEIVAAVAVVREARDLGERVRFVSVELREPAKEALAAGTPPREAFLVVLTNDDGMTHEAVVSLDDRRLVDWRDVPGVHPAIHIDEFDDAGNAIVADPRFQEALAKRGHRAPRDGHGRPLVDRLLRGRRPPAGARARVASLRPRGRQRATRARSAAWSASST